MKTEVIRILKNHFGSKYDKYYAGIAAEIIALLDSESQEPVKEVPWSTNAMDYAKMFSEPSESNKEIVNEAMELAIKKSGTEQPEINVRPIERDMAVVYETYIRENNITGKELDIIHKLYAKLYCAVSLYKPASKGKFIGKEQPEKDYSLNNGETTTGYSVESVSEKPVSDQEMNPRIAKLIIGIRNAIIEKDLDEAWHNIYQIVSPDYDLLSNEIEDKWKAMERYAQLKSGQK